MMKSVTARSRPLTLEPARVRGVPIPMTHNVLFEYRYNVVTVLVFS